MEKQLRVGEFLISLIILIGMGVAAWVNVKTAQAKQETETANLKAQTSTLTQYYQKVSDKQDEILQSISDLRVLIENKKNRDDQTDNQKYYGKGK